MQVTVNTTLSLSLFIKPRCFSPLCFSAADKQQKEVWSSRLQKWLYERFGVYIEDFRFQPEESTVETEEPLSAKRWVLAALDRNQKCLPSGIDSTPGDPTLDERGSVRVLDMHRAL